MTNGVMTGTTHLMRWGRSTTRSRYACRHRRVNQTWGNAGRNTFFGPGILNVDTSIIRNFRIRSKTLQFRLEAFNVLNRPIWNDPNTTLTSPLYGSITMTRKPMRELQLGLKFVF
jgi:hypothetical protein